MASLTFGQAKKLLAPYVSSRGEADPNVATAINFVNERFITSGQWRGNRFLTKFDLSLDADGYYYFDTVAGVEAVIQAIAVDSSDLSQNWEQLDIYGDFYQFRAGGLGFNDPKYTGDSQILRLGNVPASAGGSGTVDTQRYRVIGKIPETRQIYCLVRRGYVPLVNDSDVLIPSNRNAYRYAVQAFSYENSDELQRAETYWSLAYKCLNDETIAFEEGESDALQIQMKVFSLHSIQNLI